MPDVVTWRPEEAIKLIAQIVARLRAGELVAVPTESGYEVAAAALNPDAVAELAQLAGPGVQPAVLLGQADEALDWLPSLRGTAVRLARNFWPGPLVIANDMGTSAGQARRLPPSVRAALVRDGRLALRFPDHDWVAAAARQFVGPIALAPLANFPQQTEQIQQGRSRLGLIVDAGACAFTKPASVVQANARSIQMLREGALAAVDLLDASVCSVLFVCTGNTCRSPLAQALCVKLLCDTLRCIPAELPRHGFRVQSAGLSAMMGGAATTEAALVARQCGADLDGHRSQPLTLELLARADCIFAMTLGHLRMLASLRVPVGPTPQLLSPAGDDVDDPIGAPEEVYRACAAQVQAALVQRLPELLVA